MQRTAGGVTETLPDSAADPTAHTMNALISGFSSYGAKAPPAAAAIVLAGANSVGVCKSVLFSAEAREAGGAPIGGLAWQWFSSDPAKATVNGVGVVTGVAEGSATIYATAAGQKSNETAVKVTAGSTGSDVTQVVVVPVATTLKIGDSQPYTAVAEDCQGNPIDSVTFSWNSSRAEVATIGADGLATAVWNKTTPAATQISAAADGIPSEPVPLHVVRRPDKLLGNTH